MLWVTALAQTGGPPRRQRNRGPSTQTLRFLALSNDALDHQRAQTVALLRRARVVIGPPCLALATELAGAAGSGRWPGAEARAPRETQRETRPAQVSEIAESPGFSSLANPWPLMSSS